MRRCLSPWGRGVAVALALLLGLSLLPPPVAAAEASPTGSPGTVSLAAAATAKLATLDAARDVRLTQGATGSTGESKSFFRSPKGVFALVLMAGITAYTIKSRVDDHIHSQIR